MLIRRLFLVGLGLVYAVAFVSLWVQIHGLVGPHGIVPAQTLLDVVDARLGAARLWRLPTLAWITGASDGALDVLCGGGTIAATLLAAAARARGMAAEHRLSHDDWDAVVHGNATAGENIAYNYPTADAVMRGWLASSGHRANILRPAFRRIGVGCAVDGSGKRWWTQAFAD